MDHPHNIVYHRVYADPPPRSELAPSQLTSDVLPVLPALPPSSRPPPLIPLPVPTQQSRLRILALTSSPSHPLPPSDLLLHLGPLTTPTLASTLSYLRSHPSELKLLIAHPIDAPALDEAYTHASYHHPPPTPSNNLSLLSSAALDGIHLLSHQARTFTLRDGRQIRAFGSPLTPRGQGFPYPPGEVSPWGAVPGGLDLLVTHTAPKHHLDGSPTRVHSHSGCELLRRAVWEATPVLHVFAGVERGRGAEAVRWDKGARFVKFREERVEVLGTRGVVDATRVEKGRETVMVNCAGPSVVVVDMLVECVGGVGGGDGPGEGV